MSRAAKMAKADEILKRERRPLTARQVAQRMGLMTARAGGSMGEARPSEIARDYLEGLEEMGLASRLPGSGSVEDRWEK